MSCTTTPLTVMQGDDEWRRIIARFNRKPRRCTTCGALHNRPRFCSDRCRGRYHERRRNARLRMMTAIRKLDERTAA